MPSPRPLLSIVIVAYKSRPEIEACVASLPRDLAGRDIEVVLVDNFPADGTAGFVRERFPDVRVMAPGANFGFGRANNLGFARSTGECVLFLNPDTICNPPALAHCVGRVQAERDIGLISPRLVQTDGSIDPACRRSMPTAWDGFCRASGLAAAFPKVRWFSGYNLTHLPVDGTYDVGAINGAFMLGRREVFEQVAIPESRQPDQEKAENMGKLPMPPAIFDERFFMYGDDLDLCVRVAAGGYRIVYDGGYQIVHLKGRSVGRDYDRMSVAIFDANRDVYLKHFGGSAVARLKWRAMFGAWKTIALLRARLRGHRRVRPV